VEPLGSFAGAILARYESLCQYNNMTRIQVTDHTTRPTNPARATGALAVGAYDLTVDDEPAAVVDRAKHLIPDGTVKRLAAPVTDELN
jgi:hypothetical protein